MNSKRAKAIRRLANECSIGYRPMKKQYNKFARQSEQENKLYANRNTHQDGQDANSETSASNGKRNVV